MKRVDQNTQQRIADLVEACAGYWLLRGIAREQINEMRLELEQHLQQAVSDGKSLEAVLGPNPLAFAEAWAREMRPRFWRGGAVFLHGLVYALSVLGTSALLSQLLAHSPAFTFTLFSAFLLAGVVLAVLVLRLTGLKVNWSLALLSWSWPVTIVLLVLAAFLFSLDCLGTFNRGQPSTASASLPTLRAVTTFVGSVGVFDVMMIVGSVAVFDFCRLALRLV